MLRSRRTDGSVLHVDCTANGLAKRPARPVFEGDSITLQSLSMCQQVFSASVIGHIEATMEDEEEKNRLAAPVPHPEEPRDFLTCMLTTGANSSAWGKAFGRWLRSARLNRSSHDSMWTKLRGLWAARKVAGPAIANIQKIFAEEFPPEHGARL